VSGQSGDGHPDALTQAQQTILRQAEEIERLRAQLEADSLAQELRQAFSLAAIAGTIASPIAHSRLIELIIETAVHVIKARAASLFLIDEQTQELVDVHPVGPRSEQIESLRVPMGQGIIGLVALNAQPMAVSEAQRDPRHASDIAQRLGYLPQSILCVPLVSNDKVIGVLELLDKEGAPSFNTADIEALGLFANQAAVALEQSGSHRSLGAFIAGMLESLHPTEGSQRDHAYAFAANIEEDIAYRRALELAQLVQQIAREGEPELKVCQAVLSSFAEYIRSQESQAAALWAIR
jgi:signal transduction protein with GAF and PtsI domain